MVQQTALRIGNLISYQGQWIKVTLEILKTIRTNGPDYFSVLAKSGSVTPIRITDYFAKHYPGLTSVSFQTKERDFEINKHPRNELSWQVSSRGTELANLTFVHQLQNVVQALALEELSLPEMNLETLSQQS